MAQGTAAAEEGCTGSCAPQLGKGDSNSARPGHPCAERRGQGLSAAASPADSKGLSNPAEVEALREKVYASLEAYCKHKYPEQPGR